VIKPLIHSMIGKEQKF